MKTLYRYFKDFNHETDKYELSVDEFQVIKETECGYWIRFGSKKKFILKGEDGKRYAYETKGGALNNFILRTTKYIGILKHQIESSTEVLEYAKKIING